MWMNVRDLRPSRVISAVVHVAVTVHPAASLANVALDMSWQSIRRLTALVT